MSSFYIAPKANSDGIVGVSSPVVNPIDRRVSSVIPEDLGPVVADTRPLVNGDIAVLDLDAVEAVTPNEIGLNPASLEITAALQDFAQLTGMSQKALIANDQARPRIEIRSVSAQRKDLAANIALCFKNSESRDLAAGDFKQRHPTLSIQTAGSTTLEIGCAGVDKATAIGYVANHLEEILGQSHYTPGPLINAATNRSFLCLDADGTLWDKPTAVDLIGNNLGNSQAKDEVLNYLRAGGVLVINSGNDPERTLIRLLAGIPSEEREILLPRIVIAAGGGHSLVTIKSEGTAEIVEGYFKTGLTEQGLPTKAADYIYLGDDFKATGNDYAGFVKATHARAVCVGSEAPKNDSLKPLGSQLDLQAMHVGGETKALKEVIHEVLTRAELHPEEPLFSETPSVRQTVRDLPEVEALVAMTLEKAGGREGVNATISYWDKRNGPVHYHASAVDTLLKASQDVRGEFGNLPAIKVDKRGLLLMSERLRQRLEEHGVADTQRCLCVEGFENAGSWQARMDFALDQMHLQETRGPVRFLEPGNNDQATPMLLAQHIKYVHTYCKSRNIHPIPNIEVLVMGKGGHPTTGTFPQIGEVKAGQSFEGVTEAKSLSTTLQKALDQHGIAHQIVEDFLGTATSQVQIKLAENSTNTGQNATEAAKAYDSGAAKPRNVFVIAAVSAARRQALTFATQYSDSALRGSGEQFNPLVPKKYDTITSLPLERSEAFITNALTDRQAVAEMYAGLAERGRYYQYSYGGDFIPAEVIDQADLEDLYDKYYLLAGNRAIDNASIADVTKFFTGEFSVMEKGITWNKTLVQGPATDRAALQLSKRMNRKPFQKIAYQQFIPKLEKQRAERALTTAAKAVRNVAAEELAETTA